MRRLPPMGGERPRAHADRDPERHPLEPRGAHRNARRARAARARHRDLSRRRRRVRRQRQRVLRRDPEGLRRSRCSGTTTPPSPAGWTTASITTRRATRSTGPPPGSTWGTSSGSGRSRTPTASTIRRASRTARRSSRRPTSTSSRWSRRCELVPHFSSLADVSFIGHSHLCKVFALHPSGDVNEVVAHKFGLRKGYKYVISVGSVGQPRDCDNRACFVMYDTDRAGGGVLPDPVRHRDLGPEDLRRRPRAQLREAALPRRLTIPGRRSPGRAGRPPPSCVTSR